MKYDGYVIKTVPDYEELLSKGYEVGDLFCEVYDEEDVEMKNCLLDFNMMQSFEYDENTAESIEKGIKNMIDNEYAYLQLSKKEIVLERKEELLYRAINFMKTTLGEEGLEGILEKELGMTEDEIENALAEPEQNEEIKML